VKTPILICLLVGVLSISAGCCNSGPWPDIPTAPVTPVAGSTLRGAWWLQVSAAVDDWNIGLVALGCPAPFKIADSGHTVELVPPDVWQYPTKAGYEENGSIKILQGPTESLAEGGSSVVRHELGHGLGLEHVPPELGPSIMTSPAGGKIYPRDFQAAACSLGCGSCTGATP